MVVNMTRTRDKRPIHCSNSVLIESRRHLQLRKANNAAKRTEVINALLDMKPMMANRKDKHPKDSPIGINTWATWTKPKENSNRLIFPRLEEIRVKYYSVHLCSIVYRRSHWKWRRKYIYTRDQTSSSPKPCHRSEGDHSDYFSRWCLQTDCVRRIATNQEPKRKSIRGPDWRWAVRRPLPERGAVGWHIDTWCWSLESPTDSPPSREDGWSNADGNAHHPRQVKWLNDRTRQAVTKMPRSNFHLTLILLHSDVWRCDRGENGETCGVRTIESPVRWQWWLLH